MELSMGDEEIILFEIFDTKSCRCDKMTEKQWFTTAEIDWRCVCEHPASCHYEEEGYTPDQFIHYGQCIESGCVPPCDCRVYRPKGIVKAAGELANQLEALHTDLGMMQESLRGN